MDGLQGKTLLKWMIWGFSHIFGNIQIDMNWPELGWLAQMGKPCDALDRNISKWPPKHWRRMISSKPFQSLCDICDNSWVVHRYLVADCRRWSWVHGEDMRSLFESPFDRSGFNGWISTPMLLQGVWGRASHFGTEFLTFFLLAPH